MNHPITYYKFRTLPEEIRKANGIRSKQRLDCISYTNDAENHRGLSCLFNHKKQLFLYKTPARNFVDADSKRIAEWSLTGRSSITGSSINLSSLYQEDLDYPQFAYGNPFDGRELSNGSVNPFFAYRHDGYLFIINRDITVIELLIIHDGRNLIKAHYQFLIDGELDEEIKQLRQDSKPFYDYGYSKV
jgi:hypothetical protein